MGIQRAVIIFGTTLRPETAGVYCQRALDRFVEVRHFQPHELERMPRTGFDLYLNIDDGLRRPPAAGLPAQRSSGRSIPTLISTAAAKRRPASTWRLPPSATARIYSAA